MAEILDFGKFKKAREEEKHAKEEKEEDGPEGRFLWGQLNDDVRKLFVEGMQSIGQSIKAGHMRRLDDKKLEGQRAVVRGWSDEQTLEFLGDPTNRAELRSKPYLLTVLFERVTGKL